MREDGSKWLRRSVKCNGVHKLGYDGMMANIYRSGVYIDLEFGYGALLCIKLQLRVAYQMPPR